MMCINARCASVLSETRALLFLLVVLSLFTLTPSLKDAFSCLQIASTSIISASPPEVPHDGIRVLQPLDASELAKCPTGMPKTLTKTSGSRATWGQPGAAETRSKALSPLLLQSSPRQGLTKKAEHQRKTFVCAAGCSSREPQLEESLAPWADWKKNSSGLDMIDALEGFCETQRDSQDQFVMTVLWKGSVYLKGCKADNLTSASLYLIGPEDLSLVLVFLFGAQRIGQFTSGPIAFGMYLSDYSSLLDRHLVGPGLPIFAYLGRDTSWLIPWPSSFSVLSTQDVENWSETKKAGAQKSWEARDPKAYWIGAVTGPWEFALDDGLMAVPRMKLLRMSKEHPQQLHADWSSTAGYGISWVTDESNVSGFMAHGSHSVEELTGIAKSTYQAVDNWEGFKYYVNLDGVVMGGRLNKLLALGGVVLQHQAGYHEHTNALMKPYEHYVPIEYDLSDLVQKVEWLQQNDAEAKRIAENGRALALKRMRLEDDLCYIWRALEGLGAKTAPAQVLDSEVEQRLQKFQRTSVQAGGMRATIESFWGEKLEKVSTGNRLMTPRGIELLQWAWDRLDGINEKVQQGNI